MRRVLRWEIPEQPLPKRPYRDSLVLHLAFALIIVGVAWVTDGSLRRALVYAGVFFVLATGWSWWKWRQRLERERREEEPSPAERAAKPK